MVRPRQSCTDIVHIQSRILKHANPARRANGGPSVCISPGFAVIFRPFPPPPLQKDQVRTPRAISKKRRNSVCIAVATAAAAPSGGGERKEAMTDDGERLNQDVSRAAPLRGQICTRVLKQKNRLLAPLRVEELCGRTQEHYSADSSTTTSTIEEPCNTIQ